jgi:hypothetical protein
MARSSGLLFVLVAVVGALVLQLYASICIHAVQRSNTIELLDRPFRVEPSPAVSKDSSSFKSSSNKKRPGKFAYAFVVSGCTQTSCLGYILNTLVTAQIVQDSNSTADIVLMLQMTGTTGVDRLPTEQETWLSRAGVSVEYLNPSNSTKSNFGLATLHKFRVLTMAAYDRVLFLDADILLLCSMDYMFHESYNANGLFQNHVGIAGAVAPATASMFLVTPAQGEFDRIIDLVRQHRNRSSLAKNNMSTTNTILFDRTIGWGHTITPPDRWEAWGRRKGDTKWNFYAANADQGLLYHWLRYLYMNYTQIHADRIETWQDATYDSNLLNTDKDNRNNLSSSSTSIIYPVGQRLLAKVAERPIGDLQGCSDAATNGRGDAPNTPRGWTTTTLQENKSRGIRSFAPPMHLSRYPPSKLDKGPGRERCGCFISHERTKHLR